jgi:hypothetical protein
MTVFASVKVSSSTKILCHMVPTALPTSIQKATKDERQKICF